MNFTSKNQIITLQDDNFSGLYDTIRGVYSPQHHNVESAYPRTTLHFGDIQIGSTGNITSIVAQPTAGKTHICEAIIASRINQGTTDTLSFELSPNNSAMIGYLETELSQYDAQSGYNRIIKRSNINKDSPTDMYFSYLNIKKLSISDITGIGRQELLFRIIEDPLYDTIIIDGIADFVYSVNDERECSILINKILSGIEEYRKLLVVTLHVNPKDPKPRGHLGSEVLRKSEGVIYVSRQEGTPVRRITTDFAFNKVRNSSDNTTVDMNWSDELQYFVSMTGTARTDALQKKEKLEVLHTILLDIGIKEKINWQYNALRDKLMEKMNISSRTAERNLQQAKQNSFIARNEDNSYRILVNNSEV